jgi:tRNA A-37 threonylcarbamoyl transferase component Bud32/SAM-dependent methyltransferase
MLTRDDVIELFLVFLGRKPESESGITAAIATHADRSGLIRQLTSSAEYRDRRGWVFGNAEGKLFFHSAFEQKVEQQQPEVCRSALRHQILERLGQIHSAQGQYQPLFGLDPEYQRSPREANLLLDCSFVQDHFSDVARKGHVRIIDVGCNIGFVTFKLAETFNKTIDIDVNMNCIDLCNDVKVYTQSPAGFYTKDLIQLMEPGELDTENVDSVLLLNVIHQFIFNKGLAYVRNMLARLTKRVDVVFVELARKQDYVAHGKDHLLPDDPAAVLSDCRDCRMELLKATGRRVYKITRNEARFGPLSIRPDKIWFSDSKNLDVGRKYYSGEGKFLKVFRIGRFGQGERHAYDREKQGLLQMRGSSLAPKIFDWTVTESYGAILMEKITAPKLTEVYQQVADPGVLAQFLKQYLDAAAKLGKAKLYHNDMSGHNIYVLSDSSLRIIDFEQTKSVPVVDPFAVMLWSIFDILSGAPVSYERRVYEKLFNLEGKVRADRAVYPEFSDFRISDALREFLYSAANHNSWFEFADEWSDRFESLTLGKSTPERPSDPS